MAPNRHRVQQVALELKDLMLGSKQQKEIAVDYKPPRPVADASYWAETPSLDEPDEFFSVDHIVSHLVEDSKTAVTKTCSSTPSSSDTVYWNESSALPHHECPELSKAEAEALYRDEKSYEVNTSKINEYWGDQTSAYP